MGRRKAEDVVEALGIKKEFIEEIETWSKDIIIDTLKCKESNGQPCTCKALVKCTSAENKDETVHIVKKVYGKNIKISDIEQLSETDITREKTYTGCQNSPDKRCTLKEDCIESGKWQETYEGAKINGEEALNVESSYMICLHGDGILFFEDAGQMVRTYGTAEVINVEEYVTLEMLKGSGKGWAFREIISYNTKTSLPQYKNEKQGRDITQEDVDELNRVLNIYGINTPNRIAHFLAQGQVETNGGYYLIEQYGGDDIFKYFKEYETTKATELGNTQKGDGAKYRGAGIVQMTGRGAYESFSNYKNDPKIAEDGALYVAQNYFWEAGAYYWSVYKPSTANDDRYNFNKLCDGNVTVRKLTGVLNGDEEDKLVEREKAYAYYIGQLNGGNGNPIK